MREVRKGICPIHSGTCQADWTSDYGCFLYDVGIWRLTRMQVVQYALLSLCYLLAAVFLTFYGCSEPNRHPLQQGISGFAALECYMLFVACLPLPFRSPLRLIGCAGFTLVAGSGFLLYYQMLPALPLALTCALVIPPVIVSVVRLKGRQARLERRARTLEQDLESVNDELKRLGIREV